MDSTNKQQSNKWVWMDMEMTGLDISKDHIMEIACVITDKNLNILAKCPDIIIQHSEDTLKNMNDWCQVHHRKTGLVDACLKSQTTLQDAESILYKFVSSQLKEKESPLVGNTIYMDRMFLRKHMPRIDNYLHYRVIDVSTIKELCKNWNPKLFENATEKKNVHRALDDIHESITELKFYYNNFFRIE